MASPYSDTPRYKVAAFLEDGTQFNCLSFVGEAAFEHSNRYFEILKANPSSHEVLIICTEDTEWMVSHRVGNTPNGGWQPIESIN